MSNIVLKIHRGTILDNNDTLCKSCALGTYTTLSHGGQLVHCTRYIRSIHEKVTQCSSYYNKSLPTLKDFYETAWILESSKNSRVVGFTPWRDYAEKTGAKVPNDY